MNNSVLIDLDTILSSVPAHIYWFDSKNIMLGCNYLQAVSLGFNNINDAVGKSIYELNNESCVDILVENNAKVVRLDKEITFEEPFIDKYGSHKVYLSKKRPLKKDGIIIGIIGVSIDITKIKNKAKKLKNDKQIIKKTLNKNREVIKHITKETIGHEINEKDPIEQLLTLKEYYENLIAVMPGHIYWKDKGLNYLGCNNSQANALGLKNRNDIINRIPYEDLPYYEANNLREADKKVIKKGDCVIKEEVGVRDNGKRGYFLTYKSPLFDIEDNVIGLVGVSLDITEKKQFQDELEKINKNKTRFILLMESLLREPLNNILAPMQMLEKGVTGKYKKFARIAIENVNSIIPMLNEMNEIAYLEQDSTFLGNKVFNMYDMLERKINLYKEEAEKNNIKINFHYDEELPLWFFGVNYFISEIFLIIFSNSIKYTRNGFISVIVKKAEICNGEFLVSIKVEDSGVGIKKEDLEHIFSLFDDGIDISKIKFANIGLKLSKAKEMVRILGVDINLSSKINKGTIVNITIPLVCADEPKFEKKNFEKSTKSIIKKKEIETENHKRNLNNRILVIEDNAAAQYIMRNLLDDIGEFNISQAYNLKQAFNCINNPYDLIITDINLPDGNAIDFIRSLQKKHNNLPSIIVVTAYISEAEKEEIMKVKVDDIIEKPLDFEYLKRILKEYNIG